MIAHFKDQLAASIQQSTSADNTQPWKLVWNKNILSIQYDTERVSGLTFPADNPATLLAMGAAIENLYQAAACANIHLQALPTPSFNLSQPVYFKAEITDANSTVKFSDTDFPFFNRHTNRFSYLPKSIPQSNIKVLKNLTLNSISIDIVEQQPQITKIAQLVYLASCIRFRTRETNKWLAKSLRFGKQAIHSGDGLDVDTLDIPPGGALFLRMIGNWHIMKWLNKLGVYRFMSWIDSRPVKKAPALIAITGPTGFEHYLNAGRVMERVWIYLNEQGIAVHPYYVVSDQINRLHEDKVPEALRLQAQQVFTDSRQLFNLKENETLYMLLRVGYPKKKAKRSKRLPLEKIVQISD